LSVVTPEVAERLFPDVDASRGEQVEIPEAASYDDLVDLVLDARRAESPTAEWSDEASSNLQSQLRSVESSMATGSGVIMTCSCGHIWVAS